MSGFTLVIDFETANPSPVSACELGMVVLEKKKIIHSERFLIKTPTPLFTFTSIHGITWKHVKDSPTFKDHWETSLKKWFKESTHLVAHNIGFDRRVLESTAAHYKIKLPELTRECTVQLSRNHLKISPAKLSNVCETLGIPLNHHEALSDAKAAAYIYLYAKTGKKHWEEMAVKTVAKTKIKVTNSPKSEALLNHLLKVGKR